MNYPQTLYEVCVRVYFNILLGADDDMPFPYLNNRAVGSPLLWTGELGYNKPNTQLV